MFLCLSIHSTLNVTVRFSPRVNGKRIAKNIYATTREECEEKLKVLIAEMKKEIVEIKAGK